MDLLKELAENLRLGDDEAVRAGTRAALAEGLAADDILRDAFLAGMAVVGEEFGRREIFLPDVLLAARAMQAGMEVLRPLLARDGASGVRQHAGADHGRRPDQARPGRGRAAA